MISASQFAQLASASADDKTFRKAQKKITKLVVGVENEDCEYEGGFASKFPGLKERELGGGINWFSNAKRGAKVQAVKSESTKAKNPYSAVEFVWKKPKTGAGIKTGTKKSLSGVKIDANFAVLQYDIFRELLEEKFVWLSMYDTAEDTNKVPTYGSKEHNALCEELLGRKTSVWSVSSAPERGANTWAFELTKNERSAAFGGKGKTSYKTKYEELVALINSGKSSEELQAFLLEKARADSPATTPATTDTESADEAPVAPEPEPEPKKATPTKTKGPGRPKKEPSTEGEEQTIKTKTKGKKKKYEVSKTGGLKIKDDNKDKDGASSA